MVTRIWWEREDLAYRNGRLYFGNRDLLKFVQSAGNINEAIDLLAENILLPPVREGDYLALLNVGGYGSASSSNHCMRGTFSEYLLVK